MPAAPPDLPGSQTTDSPLDRALALLLAGEREAALRWSAATVERDPQTASALILTSRLLADAGRSEAATEGFELGIKRAIDAGNLAIAVAAVGDLRALGVDVGGHLDAIADAFCKTSTRLNNATTPPPLPDPGHDFQPLSRSSAGRSCCRRRRRSSTRPAASTRPRRARWRRSSPPFPSSATSSATAFGPSSASST